MGLVYRERKRAPSFLEARLISYLIIDRTSVVVVRSSDQQTSLAHS